MPGEVERRPPQTTEQARDWEQAWGEVHDPDPVYTPDFAMLGIPQEDGGVMLVASTHLTVEELKKRVGPLKKVDIGGRKFRLPDESYLVSLEMKDLTIIHAASYPEALHSLQEMWARKQIPG